MRSRSRDRQKIWFSNVTENEVGIDTYQEYSKPIMRKLMVSSGNGNPIEISAGLVLNTDRAFTSYDKSLRFQIKEGTVCWVDVIPETSEDGNLVMSDDGITPIVPPDYRIDEKHVTQKGLVDAYGINEIGGNANG